eukprot:7883495-Pyramimonas_sp.AAC.1
MGGGPSEFEWFGRFGLAVRPLPGLNQSSEVAELFAFNMYLDNVGLGPYEYLSDCDWVVSSFRRGRCETTGAMHA